MTMRRTREWQNMSVTLTPAANAQVTSVLLGDGTFNKGATLIRSIVDFTITPVTLDVPAVVTIALWSGREAGVDADISLDLPTSFIYWRRVPTRIQTGVVVFDSGARVSIDIRSARVSRSDADSIIVIAKADGASAMNVYVSARMLRLLP